MEQFSLEKYLENPSRKVVTRNGQSVKIRCTNFDSNSGHLIVAEIEGSGYSTTFFKDGKFFKSEETPLDLFFAPIKHEDWVNLYRTESGQYNCGSVHESEQDAKRVSEGNRQYVTTVKIEWEE